MPGNGLLTAESYSMLQPLSRVRSSAGTPPNLCENRSNHFAVHIRQTIVAPLETIGQFRVIEPEEVKNRRVQIVHVNFVFHRVEAEVICLAIDDAGLDPAPGEPHGVAVRMMVAANLIGLK